MASSTREKILAVSLRLFNEQGYRNVTMRAIADALSISVGNLTYHFAKKQDIVAALMDDVFAQMTATADMPAASLAQIDSLFSMMLDTLERCAFFFLDNELKQENGPLHLAHHTHLRARLIDGKPIAPCGRRKKFLKKEAVDNAFARFHGFFSSYIGFHQRRNAVGFHRRPSASPPRWRKAGQTRPYQPRRQLRLPSFSKTNDGSSS